MDEIAVLVLNYTYEPLHFTNAKRAITLLLAGKAESVEASPRVIRSPSRSFHLPAVIRLGAYIRKPFLERVAFNKKNILRRDGYTCQYCSRRGEKLTVDHVVPRSRGGQTTWTNVVAACLRCNLLKGNRTAGGGAAAADPRAGAPAVPLLGAPAPASARDLVPRLVAEVPGGGAVDVLSGPRTTRCCSRSPRSSPRPGTSRRRSTVSPRCVGEGSPHTVLLGVTGSGKTFTLANVIARLGRPALVISPNKTLAAQLYSEFKAFFPDNAVEYFVSYYDYYQPEAYIPQSDTYIEKDALVNDEIDRMRHSATASLLRAPRRGGGGLGLVHLRHRRARDLPRHARGPAGGPDHGPRRPDPARWSRCSTSATTTTSAAGTFRVRGDVVEVFPAAAESEALRVEFWGDTVERLMTLEPLRGVTTGSVPEVRIYPASHYVTPAAQLERAIEGIMDELRERLGVPQGARPAAGGAAARAAHPASTWRCCASSATATASRTTRATSPGGKPGQNPPTLMDYLPKDALVILDESHVTAPQLRGMYPGDRSRKEALVEYGFRLPSAFDNRPLTFEEFVRLVPPDPLRLGDPGPLRAGEGRRRAERGRPGRSRAGRWRSRSSGPPGSWTRRSRCAPPPPRWTISWPRCGPGPSATSGC